MHALVLGVETECRIGNAVYPAHYDRGWHITGTAGVFGAAVAAGHLLKLTEQQMVWAIGLAAVQPVGLREMFGSMTKSFHPGRAAQNGLMAAFLASRNFTSSDAGLEAKSGWANVLSTEQKYGEITDELGTRYEAALNSTSPSPAESSFTRRSMRASSCATSTRSAPARSSASTCVCTRWCWN